MASAPRRPALEEYILRVPAPLVREQTQLAQKVSLVLDASLMRVLRQEQLVPAVLSVNSARLNAHPDQQYSS
jgi:hypothetical protein